MKHLNHRRLAVCGSLVLGSIVAFSTVSALNGVDGAESEAAVIQLRSGDEPGPQLAFYMGFDITPSRWDQLLQPYFAAVDNCIARSMDELGRTVRPEVDPIADLRVASPKEFAKLYAYGYSLDLQSSMQARAQLDEAATDPSEAEITALGDCESEYAYMIDEVGAPREIQQRYAQLVSGALADVRYIAASKAWVGCLSDEGIDAENPMSTPSAVVKRAVELAGLGADEIEPETPIELSEQDLIALRRYEFVAYDSDQRCRARTGMDDVLLTIESELLGVLHADFPEFGGINGG